MEVLVDTPVWSLMFRRKVSQRSPSEEAAFREFDALVENGEAVLLGVVRQEVLSGLRSQAEFEDLRRRLRVFPDHPLIVDDYEVAAGFNDRCRDAGIAGTPVDMLICAFAARMELEVLTLDRDFGRYSRILRVRLR
jgi:predicted nucleic acid-binding protein